MSYRNNIIKKIQENVNIIILNYGTFAYQQQLDATNSASNHQQNILSDYLLLENTN